MKTLSCIAALSPNISPGQTPEYRVSEWCYVLGSTAFFICFSDFGLVLCFGSGHSSNPFPEGRKCFPSSCSRCFYPVCL